MSTYTNFPLHFHIRIKPFSTVGNFLIMNKMETNSFNGQSPSVVVKTVLIWHDKQNLLKYKEIVTIK